MLQRVKEVQESDLRMDGALARNIQRVLAVTQADIDAAAAQGKGWLVKRVVKVNDPLDNLRGGTQLVIKQNSILPGQNVMRVMYIGGQAVVVGPGTSPLSLPDAIADSLSYVKAFGGTEQRNLPDNYIERQFIYMMDGSYLLTDIVPTFAGHYELDMQTTSVAGAAATYLGGRDESSGNGGLRFAHITNKTFRIFGFGDYSTSPGVAADNTKYKFIWDNGSFWVYSGTTLIYSDTFTEETMPTTTPLAINGWNSGGTIGGNIEGIYLYSFKAWNAQGELVADYVPAVQKGTVPVVGFYDTVSGTFKTATAGTFAAGGEAVPTPDTPMDIVSNNGVLKFTANEANYTADNVTLGYWIRNNNGQPESSPANFYTAMMPVKPDVSYVCFGRNKETDVISGYNRIAWYDANGVWIRNSTYTQNQPGIDVAPSNAAFARFHCNINGTDVTQELVDSYNWVFQQGTAEVPYTPYSPTKVYTAGPIETIAIKDDQNTTVSTATCEGLLSVGTYTDEQEIVSGVVTRKVGVKVLDGTENIGKSGTYAGSFFVRNVVSDWGTSNNAQVYCSHFSGVTAESSYAQNKCMILNNAFNMWWASDNTPTLAQFQQWLANQYAAGTPVIIVFPLATPTTNTVTPQPMQTAAGDNTAEITQAGMAGLELEVEYVEA